MTKLHLPTTNVSKRSTSETPNSQTQPTFPRKKRGSSFNESWLSQVCQGGDKLDELVLRKMHKTSRQGSVRECHWCPSVLLSKKLIETERIADTKGWQKVASTYTEQPVQASERLKKTSLYKMYILISKTCESYNDC